MSGECTVTPGKTWSADPVTDANLNAAATPVVRVDEDAIGTRELNLEEVTPEFAEVAKAKNWIRNPIFAERGPSYSHVTAKIVPSEALRWWRRATGTAQISAEVNYIQLDGISEMCQGISCSVAGTNSGVELGQFFDEALAQPLHVQTAATFSFYFRNNTGASVTPRVQIWAWQSENTRGTPTQVYDQATTAVEHGLGTWTRLSKTIDFSALSGVENGFDLVIQVPANLTDLGHAWWVAGAQLEIAEAATEFNHPSVRSLPRVKYDDIGVFDVEDGFLAGDVLISGTDVWVCVDPTDGAPVWRPGISRVVNRWSTASTTSASTTQVTPVDNTIPQSTETVELLAVADVLPQQVGNKLRFTVSGVMDRSVAGVSVLAMYAGASTDAFWSMPIQVDGPTPVHFTFETTVASLSSQTYTLRWGVAAGTGYWLRRTSGDTFGATIQGMVEIEEVTNT